MAGCKDCGEKAQGVCDACRLVDGDNKAKTVYYCKTCGAYLCSDCSDNWSKRTQAASINLVHKIQKYWHLKFGKKHEPIIS